jgi:hypothetical protein
MKEQQMRQAFTIMRHYSHWLNKSLLMRTKLDRAVDDSNEYRSILQKMLNAEVRCQELDSELYYIVKSLKNQSK